MGYRIECDRCDKTESVKTVGELPSRWLQFHDLIRGNGENSMSPPIRGGVFCASCTKDLERWREPIPRCAPAVAA